jgi:hypothetical protein
MKFEKEYWFVYDNKPAPKIDALIDIKKERKEKYKKILKK